MASAEELKMRVAIMGATGSGKSTFINVASGSNLAVSSSLESCTIDVETATFFLNGRTVALIDTPGFDDTTRSDTDVLESITDYLSSSYSQGARLTGLIYMHRISDNRMGGPSRKNFHMLRNLCGDKNLQNVLLVTNMWSGVDPDVGNARERELASNEKFFKPALDKGARMLRHDGSQASAHAILRHLLGLKPSILLVQDEMVNQEKDLAHTTAGAEIMRELREQSGRHAKALEHLCQSIEVARLEEDEETREILQEEAKEARGRIERIQGDLERMMAGFATENSRLANENRQERRARELAEAGRRQAEAQLAAERDLRERERQEREKLEQEEAERQEREKQAREAEVRKREVQEKERERREREERDKQEREKKEQERREEEEKRQRFERARVEKENSSGCFIQ